MGEKSDELFKHVWSFVTDITSNKQLPSVKNYLALDVIHVIFDEKDIWNVYKSGLENLTQDQRAGAVIDTALAIVDDLGVAYKNDKKKFYFAESFPIGGGPYQYPDAIRERVKKLIDMVVERIKAEYKEHYEIILREIARWKDSHSGRRLVSIRGDENVFIPRNVYHGAGLDKGPFVNVYAREMVYALIFSFLKNNKVRPPWNIFEIAPGPFPTDSVLPLFRIIGKNGTYTAVSKDADMGIAHIREMIQRTGMENCPTWEIFSGDAEACVEKAIGKHLVLVKDFATYPNNFPAIIEAYSKHTPVLIYEAVAPATLFGRTTHPSFEDRITEIYLGIKNAAYHAIFLLYKRTERGVREAGFIRDIVSMPELFLKNVTNRETLLEKLRKANDAYSVEWEVGKMRDGTPKKVPVNELAAVVAIASPHRVRIL